MQEIPGKWGPIRSSTVFVDHQGSGRWTPRLTLPGTAYQAPRVAGGHRCLDQEVDPSIPRYDLNNERLTQQRIQQASPIPKTWESFPMRRGPAPWAVLTAAICLRMWIKFKDQDGRGH